MSYLTTCAIAGVEKLKPEYWLDLMEQDYVLVRTGTAMFQPEV